MDEATDPATPGSSPQLSPTPSAEEVNLPAEQPAPSEPGDPIQPGHIEGLHFTEPPQKRGWFKILLLIIVLGLVGAYLAIDSGLVNAGINLPFHIFKQETKTTPPPVTTNQNTTSTPKAQTPTVPSGFKEYKLSGTSLTFAAPLAWGDPTSVTEQGYSKRGANVKSDGTHAYTVTFAKNKDIEVAVTSNKYLPAARATLYYDYLQWCTGTVDGKIYKSMLKFTTAGGVDSPSTVTCDQGPLADADKINDSTIVQANTKDAAGKVSGDLYTKNLSDSELVVFRVKDKAMTNADDIKTLLESVKVSSSNSSSSSSL
jgi:hypothetical protein